MFLTLVKTIIRVCLSRLSKSVEASAELRLPNGRLWDVTLRNRPTRKLVVWPPISWNNSSGKHFGPDDMRHAHVARMYRIVRNLVDIPSEVYLPQTTLLTRGHGQRHLQPHARSRTYKASFFPQPTRLWNHLPESVVEAQTPWIAFSPSQAPFDFILF